MIILKKSSWGEKIKMTINQLRTGQNNQQDLYLIKENNEKYEKKTIIYPCVKSIRISGSKRWFLNFFKSTHFLQPHRPGRYSLRWNALWTAYLDPMWKTTWFKTKLKIGRSFVLSTLKLVQIKIIDQPLNIVLIVYGCPLGLSSVGWMMSCRKGIIEALEII